MWSKLRCLFLFYSYADNSGGNKCQDPAWGSIEIWESHLHGLGNTYTITGFLSFKILLIFNNLSEYIIE